MLECDDTDALQRLRKGLRVLLLEPDAADAKLCVLVLQQAGYNVTADIVTNAAEFQRRLRTGSYDVVLADYRLHDLTALDALAAVREAGLDIPLILINGTLLDETSVESIEAGAAGYVIKGNLVHLARVVRRVLDARRTPQPLVDVLETQYLTPIVVDGRQYAVALRVDHDGIEYVGRLWFADEAVVGTEVPERGTIAGRTPEEVRAAASRLSPDELRQRLDRALAEKRCFHRLRRATDEILSNVRSMNQVAILMRVALLDFEGAPQEIERIKRQLHDLVDVLPGVVGIES